MVLSTSTAPLSNASTVCGTLRALAKTLKSARVETCRSYAAAPSLAVSTSTGRRGVPDSPLSGSNKSGTSGARTLGTSNSVCVRLTSVNPGRYGFVTTHRYTPASDAWNVANASVAVVPGFVPFGGVNVFHEPSDCRFCHSYRFFVPLTVSVRRHGASSGNVRSTNSPTSACGA